MLSIDYGYYLKLLKQKKIQKKMLQLITLSFIHIFLISCYPIILYSIVAYISLVAIFLLRVPKNTYLFALNLENNLNTYFLKRLNIMASNYPFLFFLLGLFMDISHILVYIFNRLIECRTFIISIRLIYYFIFMNPLSLDINNYILLLNSLLLVYNLYIKYIDPEFKYRFSKIHAFLDTMSKILFVIGLFTSIYTVFINSRQPSPNNGGSGPSGSNGGYSGGNGGYSGGNGGPSGGNGGPSGGNGGPSDGEGMWAKVMRVRKTKVHLRTDEEQEFLDDYNARHRETQRMRRWEQTGIDPNIKVESKRRKLERIKQSTSRTEEEQEFLDNEYAVDRERRKRRKILNAAANHPYLDQDLMQEIENNPDLFKVDKEDN
jgi:hypothetical protein